jgi:hypothetical protein
LNSKSALRARASFFFRRPYGDLTAANCRKPRSEKRQPRAANLGQMDVTTVVVGIASLIVGWGLKTVTDSWTWRRQQVLDAYLELLDAVDRYGNDVGRVWNHGRRTALRDQTWLDEALAAQRSLETIDRITGKLFLVARARGGEAAIHLFIACSQMYRRATVEPPAKWEHYHASALDVVKSYHGVVDQARDEMLLTHWRDRLLRRESRFDLTERLLKELDKTDPLPVVLEAVTPTDSGPTG